MIRPSRCEQWSSARAGDLQMQKPTRPSRPQERGSSTRIALCCTSTGRPSNTGMDQLTMNPRPQHWCAILISHPLVQESFPASCTNRAEGLAQMARGPENAASIARVASDCAWLHEKTASRDYTASRTPAMNTQPRRSVLHVLRLHFLDQTASRPGLRSEPTQGTVPR